MRYLAEVGSGGFATSDVGTECNNIGVQQHVVVSVPFIFYSTNSQIDLHGKTISSFLNI